MANFGLVLSGGGARAAYQVGVLKGLVELLPGRRTPFCTVVGSSAGAINGMGVAVGADDFAAAVAKLEGVWRSLTPDRVYRTDVPSLLAIGSRWLKTVAGGGVAPGRPINHLLDTAPLRELLGESLQMERLPGHIRSGTLKGVGVSATSYLTGTAVTFFEGADDIEPWERSTRLGRRTRLTLDHVMASAAIPVFFPPVRVHGAFWGDGSMRLTAPLSPAIHLGADKLVAVTIRYARSGAETQALNQLTQGSSLSLADIGGVLLNGVFLDSVEADVERLDRINRTLSLIPSAGLTSVPHALRPIPALVLRPSTDLGNLASHHHRELPPTLRYLLAGLGVRADKGTDMMSYLAFEPSYVGKLIDLGQQDTLARGEEVRAFLT